MTPESPRVHGRSIPTHRKHQQRRNPKSNGNNNFRRRHFCAVSRKNSRLEQYGFICRLPFVRLGPYPMKTRPGFRCAPFSLKSSTVDRHISNTSKLGDHSHLADRLNATIRTQGYRGLLKNVLHRGVSEW